MHASATVRRLVTGPSGSARLLAVAAVVLTVVAVAGIAVTIGRDEELEQRPTLVVGDSVTFLSVLPITEVLGEGSSQIVARPGYRSIDLLPILRTELVRPDSPAADRDRAVFLVGYNDVQRSTVDADALTAMVRESERFACAVWLELPARPGGEPADNAAFLPEDVDRWNERLRAEAEGRDAVHVSDAWAAEVEADDGGGLVQGDGVHPTGAGSRALADAMAAAIVDVC